MLPALLLLLFANSASAFVRGSAASSSAKQHLQHAQTFRTSTTAVAAAPRGGSTRDFEREDVCHDSRPGRGSENYGRDARSTRRAFLSKVAAVAGAAASGVLPAAVAEAGQVRSIGEVKKGIEADFRTRYVRGISYRCGISLCIDHDKSVNSLQ